MIDHCILLSKEKKSICSSIMGIAIADKFEGNPSHSFLFYPFNLLDFVYKETKIRSKRERASTLEDEELYFLFYLMGNI